jgi:hypothetical protein
MIGTTPCAEVTDPVSRVPCPVSRAPCPVPCALCPVSFPQTAFVCSVVTEWGLTRSEWIGWIGECWIELLRRMAWTNKSTRWVGWIGQVNWSWIRWMSGISELGELDGSDRWIGWVRQLLRAGWRWGLGLCGWLMMNLERVEKSGIETVEALSRHRLLGTARRTRNFGQDSRCLYWACKDGPPRQGHRTTRCTQQRTLICSALVGTLTVVTDVCFVEVINVWNVWKRRHLMKISFWWNLRGDGIMVMIATILSTTFCLPVCCQKI